MSFVTLLDYIGIIVFVITGALVAARNENDIISFVILGAVTGIGGGTLRDMMLGQTPVFWIREPIYIYICLATSVMTFFTAHFISRYQKYILWADALGMALFSVVGAQIALGAGAPEAVAVLMGVITAIFGGIIRDTLSSNESLIMRKEIYATASFAGALTYVALEHFQILPTGITLWIGVAVTFSLRGAAIIYNLRLPGYRWVRTP
ncbi:MAG: hypothetical protein CL570_04620 [Alphaproteobacteria bacterium]|nr:hypothetical protein [Alphaproteobacteria bacterium]|tara:strand:+ start:4994 stop:5614 length:621 start_codon:yes stop_codon:yes gene_type:complete